MQSYLKHFQGMKLFFLYEMLHLLLNVPNLITNKYSFLFFFSVSNFPVNLIKNPQT